MKKGLKTISAIIAICVTSNVMAANAGWYFEGNFGASSNSNTNYGNDTKIKSSTNIALNLNLGYKFMPYLASEFGYTYYTNSKLQDSSGASQGKVNQYAFDLAAKAILPFSDTGFELFTKLGGCRIQTKVDSSTAGINKGNHSATGIYIGLGAGYSYYSNVTFNLQWQRAIGNNVIGNFDLYSFGISYIYG
jgi:hypothetical protein